MQQDHVIMHDVGINFCDKGQHEQHDERTPLSAKCLTGKHALST